MTPSASDSAPDSLAAKTAQNSKISGLSSNPNPQQASNVDIIDIRHDAVQINLKEEIMSSLRPQQGLKQLPTLLLYNEQGLQLFEQVS
jgi:hypothetical protein